MPEKKRSTRRKRPAPLPANVATVYQARAARMLQDDVTPPVVAPLNLAKDKDSVAIPPCEWVNRVFVKYRNGSHDLIQTTAMEMHRKRKGRDRTKGMPYFFAVAGGEYRIYLHPTPSIDIKAHIEYKPYVK